MECRYHNAELCFNTSRFVGVFIVQAEVFDDDESVFAAGRENRSPARCRGDGFHRCAGAPAIGELVDVASDLVVRSGGMRAIASQIPHRSGLDLDAAVLQANSET